MTKIYYILLYPSLRLIHPRGQKAVKILFFKSLFHSFFIDNIRNKRRNTEYDN